MGSWWGCWWVLFGLGLALFGCGVGGVLVLGFCCLGVVRVVGEGGGGGRVLGNNQIISVQRAARLPRFILVGGFSDTLLVVSILDISL